MEVLLVALVAALTLGVARRHWWLTRVRGWSMYPTLRPGDLVVTRPVYGHDGLHRGDLVVLDAPGGRRVVKRIVGLPGEAVRVTPGGVSIGGQPVTEPFVRLRGGGSGSFQVPPDGYVVLGDNRRHSTDSRSWDNPYPTRAAIRGRVVGSPLAALVRASRRAMDDDPPATHTGRSAGQARMRRHGWPGSCAG